MPAPTTKAPGTRNRPPLKKAEVITALRATAGIRSLAAAKLNVAGSTITRFMQRHPDLCEIEDQIVAEICDLAVGQLITQIKSGEFPAIKYYLDNKGQAHGFGVRKLAFTDGEGNTMVPGVLVAPKRELDADEWSARNRPAEG